MSVNPANRKILLSLLKNQESSNGLDFLGGMPEVEYDPPEEVTRGTEVRKPVYGECIGFDY